MDDESIEEGLEGEKNKGNYPSVFFVVFVLDWLVSEDQVSNKPENDDGDTEPESVVFIHVGFEITTEAESSDLMVSSWGSAIITGSG